MDVRATSGAQVKMAGDDKKPQPLQYITYNVNDMVFVKLTQHGRDILRKEHNEEFTKDGKVTLNYRPPQEDKDGWSQWQVWTLMNALGKHMGLGMPPVFETEVRFVVKWRANAENAARYEYLREKGRCNEKNQTGVTVNMPGNDLKAAMGFRYWVDPETLDKMIDSMMAL